jgi:GDP-4-dehydro-6-deoxy-D-mannose reductase
VRVLVTGAGGFCGRHLVRHLEQSAVEVHTVGPTVSSRNHHRADRFDVAAIRDALARSRPSYVMHVAGVSSGSDIPAYYAANTWYAAALFEALESAGADCPVLLVGTSAEYGSVTPEQLPITEETVARPCSHYGISKLAQTQMALAVAAGGRAVVVVRPFNIIGPGMPEHGAVQSFARQVADIIRKRREPVVHVGNLQSSRDLVSVDDVVAAWWSLIRTPDAYGQVINVCTGTETTMSDVLAMLVEEAGVPIEVRTESARLKRIDTPRHYGSNDKLRALVGGCPPKRVRSTLRRILEALVREP